MTWQVIFIHHRDSIINLVVDITSIGYIQELLHGLDSFC